MGIVFHCASGSPYAWRVWLALEYKGVDYELRLHSLSAGDTLKADFLRLNPRHKVPVLVDDGHAISESAAILEYLDDRFPIGRMLFPGDARTRAQIRRLVREIDEYLGSASRRLVHELWFTPRDEWDLRQIEEDAQACRSELAYFGRTLSGDHLAGVISAADFSLYPRLAVLMRLEAGLATLAFSNAMPPRLTQWMRRIEALPFFGSSYPPYWPNFSQATERIV